MVKKRNRIFDWNFLTVELFLLVGILTPKVASADITAYDKRREGTVNRASQLNSVDLYLDVTLNGNRIGLTHFDYAAGKFYTSVSLIRKLGFRINQVTSTKVCLCNIQHLQIDYNAREQTLKMTAPLKMLDSAPIQLNQTDITNPVSSISPGMLLNYDIYAADENAPRVSSFSELRVFNESGVLSSTQLTRNSFQQSTRQDNQYSRLDTNWQSSFADELLKVVAGDTLTSSLSWTRPTRIAGIQVGTDFSLHPYLRTAPLPMFLGSATLPSTVEMYVNGIKQYNSNVPSGNFEIYSVPNISGAGTAQVMMTDVLGRTTTQSFKFYNDQQLLRKGLTDWSAEVGVVRRNYGYSSFDYGSIPIFSSTLRRGVSNSLTVGTHVESTDRLVNAGFSIDWVPSSRAGTLSAAIAKSTDLDNVGSLFSAGYRWSGYNFNFSTSTTTSTDYYLDVASGDGSHPIAFSNNTVVGYGMRSLGNFSLSYLQFRYPQESSVSYAGANWFKSVLEDVYLNVGFNQNINNSRDSNLYLAVTFTFSNGINASSIFQRMNDNVGVMINASRPKPADGGWGWNLGASHQSSRQSSQGEMGYMGRYGNFYAGINNRPELRDGYVGGSGSLVLMAGDIFVAREINNGFAVVSTDGIAGVPVKLENNLVGVTNDQGLLLVAPLNSYQNNLLSIDPMNLPARMQIGRTSLYATPADRSGVLLNFDIKPVKAAQVMLVDVKGNPISEGSFVTLLGGIGHSAIVGFDGMVYFDSLELHNWLEVTTASGVCSVTFDYPNGAMWIPQIGPLTCR